VRSSRASPAPSASTLSSAAAAAAATRTQASTTSVGTGTVSGTSAVTSSAVDHDIGDVKMVDSDDSDDDGGINVHRR
jgi:hypothetical protein